jgi:hypothetical protein
MVPQSKGGQKLKKKTIEHSKGWFLNTQKVPFMFFFPIKIQTWYVEIQMALLYHFKSFKMNKK